MAEGYNCTGTSDCAPTWLDEFLCEYVDGAMDDAVREAFEECLMMDSVLAEQVERLRSARSLLCRYRCRAPRDLRARVRQRVALEMMRSMGDNERPQKEERTVAGTVLAVFVLAGMFASTSFFAPPPPVPIYMGEQAPHDATAQFVAMTPLEVTPAGTLPAFTMEPSGLPHPGQLPWSNEVAFHHVMHSP